jgi:TRAP-type C4-dicarboxylate transport system substrate-binding protein
VFLHRDAFDAWPADLQQAMREAVAEAVTWQRAQAIEEELDARRAIEAQGCAVAELTAEEHAEFAKAVRPLYDEARGDYEKRLFDLLPAAL